MNSVATFIVILILKFYILSIVSTSPGIRAEAALLLEKSWLVADAFEHILWHC